MNIFSAAISLFLVMNATGNVPLFIAMLGRYDIKRQRKIILRELLFALALLLIFGFFGDAVLDALGITRPIIGIAGGTLLFLIALGMIFPRDDSTEPPLTEPMIVPLAMPVITGPGSISTVMIYSQLYDPFSMAAIILIAWVPSLLILLAASNVKYILGEKGLIACERLGGMLVCLIAIHMLTAGIIHLIKENFQGV